MVKKAAARKTSRKVARLGSKAMRDPATVSDDEVQSLGASVVSQAESDAPAPATDVGAPPVTLVASEEKSPPDQGWRSRNRLT